MEPEEWDFKFGDMIDLKNIPKNHLSKEWLEILAEKKREKEVLL